MLTVTQAKDELKGMVHGKTLNRITNINGVFDRAAREVHSNINPRETRRIQNLVNAIHKDIHDYTIPSDVKEIIDIRPQTNRGLSDNMRQVLSEEFDLYKGIVDNVHHIKHDDGSKSIRINKFVTPQPVVINDLNSLTGNGTWTAEGGGSNIAVDSLFFISGSASIKYDVGASGGAIVNDTMTKVDLEEHDEISTIFVRAFFPDASKVTNVILRWGTSTTVYWSRTENDRHDSTAFQNGWNILGFAWDGASETGTVDPTVIDFLRPFVTTTSADTDIRIDHIVSSIGRIFEIEYYSNFLFRSSSGTFQEKVQQDTDIINLDVDSYNCLLWEILMLVAQQESGKNAAFDVNFCYLKLHGGNKNGKQVTGLYDLYKDKYPDEKQPAQGTYYRL